MNTTKTPDRFAALPDEDTLAATVTALEEHGFSVEVADDLDAVLEDGRAVAAYGQHSYVGKILEIHAELPGRIHIVLVRQPAGY
jgi:hypothetical protein